jgi:signal transduction histidine kinase
MNSTLIRYACLLLVAGIASRGVYTGYYEAAQYGLGPYWIAEWSAGCAAFALCFLAAWRAEVSGRRRPLIALLVAEALLGVGLVAAYPSYITTCLMVVVAWQIAWNAPVRVAVWAALAMAVGLALLKCVSELPGLPLVILLITAAFELFAIGAAHLARSEALARAELQGAQAVLADSARMAERLRISRDLHDLLGHHLTIMTIHLDVARRLSSGRAAEHVQCARDVAADLLAEVRSVVREVRVGSVDLEATLRSLAASAVGLEVALHLPDALAPLDPPRADAITRCVQEVITNTLRHARASALEIRLDQAADGSVSIATRDDGQGSAAVVGGSGLAGMRERFELLGGSLSFVTSPGKGFALRGAIPGAEPVS